MKDGEKLTLNGKKFLMKINFTSKNEFIHFKRYPNISFKNLKIKLLIFIFYKFMHL